MDRDVRGGPLVLHTLPGRLRVHVPGWSAHDGPRLEWRLLRVPGVTHARANPLTGNVLVHYRPGIARPDAVLAALRGAGRVAARRRRLRLVRRLVKRLLKSRSSVLPIDPFAERPMPGAALRLLAALLGLGFLALRRLGRWRRGVPGGGALALALDALAFVQELPGVREFIDRFLGRGPAELARQGTAVAALLLGGSPVSLVLAGAVALLQLSGTTGVPEPVAA